MNNDLFDCSPLKLYPNYEQDYREQHERHFDSSFGNELILDRVARATDGASWMPQEQQDYSSTGGSEEPLEYYIPQFGNHAQPWRRVPCRITPPPPPPSNCNNEQQQHDEVHARNHPSNQHQQAEYFFSLKNNNYDTTHEKRITNSGRVADSTNGALLFDTKNSKSTETTTTSFPVNDTSIQQEVLPVSSPYEVHAQGESTSLLGASPFKMTVLFAAASSVGNNRPDKNATTEGENKACTITEETKQDKAPPSRRRKSKKTQKPTVQERNALSRARSAELRNRLAFIRNIPETVRTIQEKQELEQEEARKLKKSLQSKQRLALENANLARIQALAPEQWTNNDKDFMAKINARKQRKSQTDRQRRERLKQAKEKAQLAALRQLMSI
jgi:hypothetical protein